MTKIGNKWKFICKCGDGSAFFEHKVTGEIVNWFIDASVISISACQYFSCKYNYELATKANQFKQPNRQLRSQ